ncbi:MAG TPA: hypothetical protein VF175_03095 [Lacipirellula sp.]
MTAATPLLPLAWLNAPITWLLVGVGLSLATIGLVSLLRTRWRYVKAWKKCALLSFWVHVLLAYVATVIQVASAGLGVGPGEGPGPPIEVALVTTEITPLDEVSSLVVEEPAADAASESREEAKPVAGEPATDDEAAEAPPTETAAPLEAPELLAEPEIAEPPSLEAAPEPFDEPALDEVVTEESPPAPASEPPPDAAADEAAKPEQQPGEPPSQASSAATAREGAADGSASSASAPTNAAPVPEEYADRFASNRSQLVVGGGGNANTERAVAAALAWLAAAQEEDGRWNPQRHGAGQERYTLGQDRGGAGAKADTGISGLALLAFLGAGHSHREGPYSTEVARGLDYLRRVQKSNGNLSGDAELFAQTYCHSMASFAVGEAYALTKDKRLDPIVRAATAYSLAIQHPTDGGWRYRPGDTGDTSQLGWQVMALKSGELAGLAVPDATWTRVDRFLRRVSRGQAGGLAVYRPEEALPSRPMTAEALYCRQLVTGRADGGLSPAGLNEAVDMLLKQPPSLGEINLYYWYYATLALHRAQAASPQAADAWRQWNEALTATLLASQNEDGSWPQTCIWGGYGGRVYTTALAAMCLEVYYRYAPSDAAQEEQSIATGAHHSWR